MLIPTRDLEEASSSEDRAELGGTPRLGFAKFEYDTSTSKGDGILV